MQKRVYLKALGLYPLNCADYGNRPSAQNGSRRRSRLVTFSLSIARSTNVGQNPSFTNYQR